MTQAVTIAQAVKDTPARAVLALADRYLRGNGDESSSDGEAGTDAVAACCAAATASAADSATGPSNGEAAKPSGCCCG